VNDKKRRAIVWEIIERIAFRPSSSNDCRSWLGVYAKTLHDLWGIDQTVNRYDSADSIDIPFLMLKCNFTIKSVAEFSVSLIQDPSAVCCYWANHIVPIYLSKGALFSENTRYPSQQRSTQLRGDIEAVLNGMIFHPRCHTHLEDIGIKPVQLATDKDGLSTREARIGGGIENPYIFLFHLRYQFCLVSNRVRQDERTRLIGLFEDAINHNHTSVNARDLFNFTR
jgi:hypothetical protein